MRAARLGSSHQPRHRPREIVGARLLETTVRSQPFITQSRAALVSGTIAGTPSAAASATTNPCVSYQSDGSTSARAAAHPRSRTSSGAASR